MPKIICPRCGQEGYLVSSKVKGKRYLYVSHREGKKTVKHYIGPADGYTAVNRLYNLNLTNIVEVDLEDVISSLLDRVEEAEGCRKGGDGEEVWGEGEATSGW